MKDILFRNFEKKKKRKKQLGRLRYGWRK